MTPSLTISFHRWPLGADVQGNAQARLGIGGLHCAFERGRSVGLLQLRFEALKVLARVDRLGDKGARLLLRKGGLMQKVNG